MAHNEVKASHFLDDARSHLPVPALLARGPSLTPPGAETARFEGHADAVTALCVLVDGRLASRSSEWDGTIRLWDPATGTETARLKGHAGAGTAVTALCVLADGRLASGKTDNTIRLWDPATGAETTRLEGDAPINCLAALTGVQIIAGDHLGRLHWLEVVG